MKFLIIVFLLVSGKYFQDDQLKDVSEASHFVADCLNLYKTINSEKYYSIRGIAMIVDREGVLKKYKITFENKKIQLSKKDYKWLFNRLKIKGYKKCAVDIYSEEEINFMKEFYLSMKFFPK